MVLYTRLDRLTILHMKAFTLNAKIKSRRRIPLSCSMPCKLFYPLQTPAPLLKSTRQKQKNNTGLLAGDETKMTCAIKTSCHHLGPKPLGCTW